MHTLALSAILAAGLIAPVPVATSFGTFDPVPAVYAAKKKSSKVSRPKTQRVKSDTTKKGKRVSSYKRSRPR